MAPPAIPAVPALHHHWHGRGSAALSVGMARGAWLRELPPLGVLLGEHPSPFLTGRWARDWEEAQAAAEVRGGSRAEQQCRQRGTMGPHTPGISTLYAAAMAVALHFPAPAAAQDAALGEPCLLLSLLPQLRLCGRPICCPPRPATRCGCSSCPPPSYYMDQIHGETSEISATVHHMWKICSSYVYVKEILG